MIVLSDNLLVKRQVYWMEDYDILTWVKFSQFVTTGGIGYYKSA